MSFPVTLSLFPWVTLIAEKDGMYSRIMICLIQFGSVGFVKIAKSLLLIVVALTLSNELIHAQSTATPTPTPGPAASPSAPPARQAQRPVPFNLADYGVAFESDPRLIVVMAALDAAGFDPVASGRAPSVFRARVRKDQAELDPGLRERLQSFYHHNKLPAPATAADQAARYVSLAYALGQPPGFDPPDRSDELPAGVLEVLDFVPLVREFYRKSGIDERLALYLHAYQNEGDRLRPSAAELVRQILSYLHTRPITVSAERTLVRAPTASKNKNNTQRRYEVREHERHFYIVPDLLAAPGTINLRVIADDYYAIVPEGIDPASSELRRAYLRYVIDPLMVRFNKEIAARREPLKQLLKQREGSGVTVTPDVFIAVARSFVAAADARFDEFIRLRAIGNDLRNQLVKVKGDAQRAPIVKAAQESMNAVQDETVAELADEYEHGAVLAFFFADQLKDIETSGFDIANFFPDMIASFDPEREGKRLTESAAARTRADTARQTRLARRAVPDTPVYDPAETAKMAGLVRALSEIEQTLRQKDYNGAEARLKELIREYPREPRIFFALAQTASVAAADATDETVQAQRLNNALGNYRLAIEAASPETDPALISRAHEAMGRIHAFFDRKDEAAIEFDAAIKIGNVPGGALDQAIEGKKKLGQPK